MDAATDIEAIKQLKARYFRLMDSKDWDGLAQVFTPDVEIDMTGEGGGVTRSVEEYLPYLRENIEDVTTVHHGHMPEITLDSPTVRTRRVGDGRQAVVAGGWTSGSPSRLRALPRDVRQGR